MTGAPEQHFVDVTLWKRGHVVGMKQGVQRNSLAMARALAEEHGGFEKIVIRYASNDIIPQPHLGDGEGAVRVEGVDGVVADR